MLNTMFVWRTTIISCYLCIVETNKHHGCEINRIQSVEYCKYSDFITNFTRFV